jgi:hypothetical protein
MLAALLGGAPIKFGTYTYMLPWRDRKPVVLATFFAFDAGVARGPGLTLRSVRRGDTAAFATIGAALQGEMCKASIASAAVHPRTNERSAADHQIYLITAVLYYVGE